MSLKLAEIRTNLRQTGSKAKISAQIVTTTVDQKMADH
jgi:hypothetical protein